MNLWGVVPVVLLLLQMNCFLKKGHLLNPNDQNRDWDKFFIKTNNLFDHHVWILSKQGKGTWDKHFILFYSRKESLDSEKSHLRSSLPSLENLELKVLQKPTSVRTALNHSLPQQLIGSPLKSQSDNSVGHFLVTCEHTTRSTSPHKIIIKAIRLPIQCYNLQFELTFDHLLSAE